MKGANQKGRESELPSLFFFVVLGVHGNFFKSIVKGHNETRMDGSFWSGSRDGK